MRTLIDWMLIAFACLCVYGAIDSDGAAAFFAHAANTVAAIIR